MELLNDPMEGSIEDMLKHLEDVTSQSEMVNYTDTHLVSDEFALGRAIAYSQMVQKLEKNSRLKTKYELLKYCKNNIGILSLTKDPLNPLMWSLYANIYNGICIGFDTNKLLNMTLEVKSPFDNCTKLFQLLKVKYKDEAPIGKNLTAEEYVISAFGTKFKKWSHEQEYRFVRPMVDTNAKVLIIPQQTDIITEIYIGQRFSISGFLEKVPNHTRLFVVKNQPNNYRLSMEEFHRS